MTTSEPTSPSSAVELLAVLAIHGDGIEDDVGARAERRPQLGVVRPVGHDRLDAELREPGGQRAGARDGDDLPAVERQRARRGAADHAGAPDQNRPRHQSSASSTCSTLCRAAKAATTPAASTMPPAISSARWTP